MTVVRQEPNAQPTKHHATSSIQRIGRNSATLSIYRCFSKLRPLAELSRMATHSLSSSALVPTGLFSRRSFADGGAGTAVPLMRHGLASVSPRTIEEDV